MHAQANRMYLIGGCSCAPFDLWPNGGERASAFEPFSICALIYVYRLGLVLLLVG